MSDRIGWLHHKDDDSISALATDGFCWEPDDPEIATPAALDVPTIDVDPESVTDREAQRELDT